MRSRLYLLPLLLLFAPVLGGCADTPLTPLIKVRDQAQAGSAQQNIAIVRQHIQALRAQSGHNASPQRVLQLLIAARTTVPVVLGTRAPRPGVVAAHWEAGRVVLRARTRSGQQLRVLVPW